MVHNDAVIRRRLELLKIWRTEQKLTKERRELAQKLRAKNASEDESRAVRTGLAIEILECHEDRRYLYHQELEQKATRLYISLPPRTAKELYEEDEYWRGLPVTQRWVLNPKGIRQVRSEIREEMK